MVKNYVRETPRRASSLRGLGAYGNVFAIESFMDELARAVSADPIEFRLKHLKDPRARAVLEALKPRWNAFEEAETRGHGVAFARYKNIGAYCAVLAEVEAGEVLRVKRLVVAADVGLVDQSRRRREPARRRRDPVDELDAQGRGPRRRRVVGGLSHPQVLARSPPVEVHVLKTELPSLGAGEAAQGPTAAAIANALHDALGVRVRDLPLTPERIVKAMG